MDIKKIYNQGTEKNKDWRINFLELDTEFNLLMVDKINKYSKPEEIYFNNIERNIKKYMQLKRIDLKTIIENNHFINELKEKIKNPIKKYKVNMKLLEEILSTETRKVTFLDQLYFIEKI